MGGFDNRESDSLVGVAEYCSAFMTPMATTKKYYHLPIRENKPCFWIKSSWPDCRRRMYISNILERTCQQIEICIQKLSLCVDREHFTSKEDAENSLKELENSVLKRYPLKLKENWSMFSVKTALDIERWKIYEGIFERMKGAISMWRIMLKQSKIRIIFERLEKILQELRPILENPQPDLPDVILWMESNQKRIGYCKISARDLLFSRSETERGKMCGKIENLFFRHINKKQDEILAKVDIYLWLGLSKQSKYCLNNLPKGFYMDSTQDNESQSTEDDARSQPSEESDVVPRVLNYYEKQNYQLRVHIYQARSLPWSDMSKFPSPVAQLFIQDRSLRTQIRENTLNPIWDETLIFNHLEFYGNETEIKHHSPNIVFEIIDFMLAGKSNCVCRGIVSILQEASESGELPLLKWYDISSEAEIPTQILAAFELFPIEEGNGDTTDAFIDDWGPIASIPPSIRPRFSPHRIEILFWGLRELQRINLMNIKEPRLTLECGGKVVHSSTISDYAQHPNFLKMVEFIDLDLPEREEYFPAITIRLEDVKSFGRLNVTASHIIHNLQSYVVRANGEVLEPKFEKSSEKIGRKQDVAINVETFDQFLYYKKKMKIPWTTLNISEEENGAEKAEQDWWSRYYISTGEKLQRRKTEAILTTTSIARKMPFIGCILPGDVLNRNQPRTSLWNNALGEPFSETASCNDLDAPVFFPNAHKNTGTVSTRASITGKKSLVPTTTNGLTRINNAELFEGDFETLSMNNLNSQAFVVYNCELEAVPEFGGFNEWLHSFELIRGRRLKHWHHGDKIVAIFKGCFRIYELPLPPQVVDPVLPLIIDPRDGLFQGLPENNPTKLLLRLYIVKAIDLTPSDVTNTTDAYIAVQFGKQRFADKKNYVPKQLNPVFGKCFEFVVNCPCESLLHIQVWDWDLMGSDDLIGETKIDLESRLYSRHRPTCGLARTYETDGPNAWRDALTPLEILTRMCEESGLGEPRTEGEIVCIGNQVYDFSDGSKGDKASEQNMALYLLHRWEDISPGKYPLVPEHLETRTLYHPSKLGESQGKLVMWLDIFPEKTVPPVPPRDISPRKPSGYELRVIVWNTDEVVLSDDAFFTGEKMSDIYVKGWLTGKEDAQCTDVHYRSLTGEGNFNWRFVFPFDYLAIERKMVVKKKVSVFSWDETEFKLAPELKLQVWDADHFKPDDCLGELTLDLHQFPRGAKSARKCSLKMLKNDDGVPQVSIFKQRRLRGWWPVSAKTQNGQLDLTGKIEIELHLLTKDEALKFPAGLGRKEPDLLQEPKRPETSFLNFLHPLKTFRYTFWKHYRRKIIITMILIALTLIFLLFVYSVPGYTVKRLIGA